MNKTPKCQWCGYEIYDNEDVCIKVVGMDNDGTHIVVMTHKHCSNHIDEIEVIE